MATKQLLQILLKSREGIQSGAVKVKDIVTEYLTSTGAKTISPDERYTINKEFSELAPSNVVGDIFGDFQGLQDDAADVITDTPVTNKIREQNPGVEIRGDETFGELTEKLGKPIDSTSLKDNLMQTDNPFSDLVKTTEKGPKTLEQRRADAIKELGLDKGVGSLYPKGGLSEEIKRDDLAGFMREMRKAGIKNEDVMDVAKITDVAEGKRAATTLARAADMGADTKIKQEFLSELDEKIMDNGPRYFQEEYQGYDSYGELINNKGIEVRNAIYDDLEELGVDEERVSSIMRYANDVAKKNPYQPEAFIDAIKQDIELEGIKYDMSFWENYISKILELSSKAEPRFADGGLV